MKAVLKDGTELAINSYSNLTENRFQVSFAGVTAYDALRAKFTVLSLQSIKIYTSDTTFDTFENYTKIVDPSTVTIASNGTMDVVILFEREDELSQRVRANEQDIVKLYEATDFLLARP